MTRTGTGDHADSHKSQTYGNLDETGASPTSAKSCFHCGLPLPTNGPPVPTLHVLGAKRSFCCHGCHGVCETITGAGLEDYYETRSHPTSPDFPEDGPGLGKPGFFGSFPPPEDLDLFDREDIQQGFVTRSGPDGQFRQAALLLENIRCPACLWLNEKHLRALPGIVEVQIDDATTRAFVTWDPAHIRVSEILTAIAAIGYRAHPFDASKSNRLLEARDRRSFERILFAGLTGMMVMQFSIVTYLLVPDPWQTPLPIWVIFGRWSALLITTLIMIYSGRDFFVGAWRDLRSRRLGMDVPIVLGLSLAWLGSLHATWQQRGDVYYDSIAMFITFVLLARRWELSSRMQAVRALDRLSVMQPQTATRLLPDTSEKSEEILPVQELAIGDRIKLSPGETVPVDLSLETKQAEFDEAFLTGEHLPVLRKAGEEIRAGTINMHQRVTGKVLRGVAHSALTRMQTLVTQGITRKPAEQLLTEWIAQRFVLAILIIASITALVWGWLNPDQILPSLIAVLIITCPCALSLAAPTAQSIASSRLIEMNVMPLDMARFEPLAHVDTVLFDKTGTLTTGQFRLCKAIFSSPQEKNETSAIAATLASLSEHPLSIALASTLPAPSSLLQKKDAKPFTPKDVKNMPGGGIRARISGDIWRLGKLDFVTEKQIGHREEPLPASLTVAMQTAQEEGHSLVFLAKEGQAPCALFILEDRPRPDIDQTLRQLRQNGIQSIRIVSGDLKSSVTRLGRTHEFDHIHWQMRPEDKQSLMRNLQQQGHRVLMIGDGLNDAPTLAQADVSMSFSSATDLANINSDFMLKDMHLIGIAKAHALARQTRRNIHVSLGWALGYNLLAIPFAAAGWIPPWGAAIGMSLSSLIVVLNALRLTKNTTR